MHITDYICFTWPIGWDEFGVIANRKATKQLKSALEMQEQSKNVGLLDRRIELAEKIQSGKSVSELTLQVLFNEEILEHYRAWQSELTKKVYADHDLDRFYSEVKTPDGAGGFYTDVRDTLEKFLADMSRPDCPDKISSDYEKYCLDHTIYLPDGETGASIPYNHSEISTRIANATKTAKSEQNLTLQFIKKYISDSIKSLSTK